MARMDFPSTEEGIQEFKQYGEKYKDTGKMKLLIIGGKDVVIRTNLATRYDTAYIRTLTPQQVKEIEDFFKGHMDIWHIARLYWDEEVKERKVE